LKDDDSKAKQPGRIFEEPVDINGRLVPKDDRRRVKINYVIEMVLKHQ